MSRCTDRVVTRVPCNLTLTGFLKLCFRQFISFSLLCFSWPYFHGFGVWLAAGKMSEVRSFPQRLVAE